MNALIRYRVWIVALTSAAGVIASSGLVSGTAERWISTLIASVSAGLVLIWHDPNTNTTPAPVDVQGHQPVSSDGQTS